MGVDLDERLSGIAARLDRLRALDRPRSRASFFVTADGRRLDGYALFGADLHRYRSEPLSEERLRALETAMGITLPGDFRAFLERIGTGAGPYYGIGSYEELSRSATPDCARPFPPGESGPFFADDDDDGLDHGYLPIARIGCGYDVNLVTAGPQRGRVFTLDPHDVWTLDADFLTFYETWLDGSIRKLGQAPPERSLWKSLRRA